MKIIIRLFKYKLKKLLKLNWLFILFYNCKILYIIFTYKN